jgi:hypothetical protein
MTDTTAASFGAFAFLCLSALLAGALIWLGHLRYMLG